jgi:hypothetical protein
MNYANKLREIRKYLYESTDGASPVLDDLEAVAIELEHFEELKQYALEVSTAEGVSYQQGREIRKLCGGSEVE